jgi:cytochrome c oxidase assembly protein subunit 15
MDVPRPPAAVPSTEGIPRHARDGIGRVERAPAQRWQKALALTGVVLMLVVVAASAYLRLSQTGPGCTDWPACYGAVTDAPRITGGILAARAAHRFAAGTLAALLVAELMLATMQRPRRRAAALIALAALLIAAGLAVMGAVLSERTAHTSLPPLPAVTLANLLGGFTLLALMTWLYVVTREARPVVPRSVAFRTCAALALVTAAIEVALGGLVSARFAAFACPGFPSCGVPWSATGLRNAFDPWLLIAPPSSALAALHWIHRLGAVLVAASGGVVASWLWRVPGSARRWGATLALLLVALLGLGASEVRLAPSLVVALAHNVTAALLVAVLVVVNHAACSATPAVRSGRGHATRR